MKFVIDNNQLKQLGIPMGVLGYILPLYFGERIKWETFDEACTRGLMTYSGIDKRGFPINPTLTNTGIEFIESLFLNSEFREEEEKEDRFDKLASQMRELFPKGRKEGTSYMWRDSNTVIARRLKALIKKYQLQKNPNFTDDKILEATKRYVSSFNGNYQFMQLLKYFIIKRLDTGEEVSQLLSYIENEGEELSTDWAELV